MPSGVGGGILSGPPVKPDEGALWVFVNGAWQQSHLITAAAAFDLTGKAGTANLPPPVFPGGTPLSFVGSVTNIMEGIAWAGQGWRLIGRLAGGSRGADAATPNGVQLITLQGYGHDGTSWLNSPASYYSQITDGPWSGANQGVYHIWQGTVNGSVSTSEFMRAQGGNLLIGTSTNIAGTGGLKVAGTTASTSTTTGALQVAGGAGIVGNLCLDGSTGASLRIATPTANAAVAVTFGGVGPTGSTAGNAQGWLRISVAGTDRYIPFW